MNDVQHAVGEQLREAREAKGLSLRQLSENSGVAFARIWEIEKGAKAAQIDTIGRIAEALDIDTLHLKG